jgi:SAM-dependent MidA family methyltransferase
VTKLFEIIRFETTQLGVLSFARFMELALYCPNYGYYELQKDNPGQHGDFYTNVSTGELFGQLLAFQFAEWLESEVGGRKSEIRIVEAGAHNGKLAKDILNWLQLQRPVIFKQIEYLIIEPSARRQEWQRDILKQFAPHIRWVESLSSIHDARCTGIIFSNELLDAMPVHRFSWDVKNKKWFEWGVAVDGDKFIWTKIPAPDFRFPTSELESVLPDNYTVETSPAAQNWWREAANILKRGKLMTIDYGFTADEMFSPARMNGTLRAYFHHRVGDDLLANVGEQDLTAHVNFSAIQTAGEAAGLITDNFSMQPQFLTQIFGKILTDKNFGEWNASRTRQFQTLTHPEHLGRAFRVLVQSR